MGRILIGGGLWWRGGAIKWNPGVGDYVLKGGEKYVFGIWQMDQYY